MFQTGIHGRSSIGSAYLAGVLAYGWQEVTTDRNALLTGLRANFDANSISGRIETGYRHASSPGSLVPYAAAQFTTLFLPNYTEQSLTGDNTFALSYPARRYRSAWLGIIVHSVQSVIILVGTIVAVLT